MITFGVPLVGTPGDDNLTGSGASETFDVSQGGNDTVRGKGGDDIIQFGGTYTQADKVFGGGGVDVIILNQASAPVVFAGNITSVEQISVVSDANHTVTIKDAAVVAGVLMNFDGGSLDVGNHFSLDASAETDGRYFVNGSGGDDVIKTGAGNDEIFGGAGADIVRPGTGDDFIEVGDGDDLVVFTGDGAFTNRDHVDGGELLCTVRLSGDYSAGVTFRANTFTNLQNLELVAGNDYTFDAGKLNPYDFFHFRVLASGLGAHDTLKFDGSSVTNTGSFFFNSGDGDDELIGSVNSDTIIGGGGTDTITGGKGIDTYMFAAVSDSTGKKYDTVIGFNANEDFFFIEFDDQPEAVASKVNGGALSKASFNSDLATALGASELPQTWAVLFEPDAGDLANRLFLVVDSNGVAGYQANSDIVVRLVNATHMNHFDESNFGTPG